MRNSISLLALTVAASGAVAANRGVGYDGAQATVAGQKVLGASRNAAADTEKLTLDVLGTTTWESGAAIAVGDKLVVDAQGRVVPAAALAVANPTVNAGAVAVTSTAANGAILTQGAITGSVLPQHIVGEALEAAAGAGEFIEVLQR